MKFYIRVYLYETRKSSSRKWRTMRTPTTDYKIHVLHRIGRSLYKLGSATTYKMQKERIDNNRISFSSGLSKRKYVFRHLVRVAIFYMNNKLRSCFAVFAMINWSESKIYAKFRIRAKNYIKVVSFHQNEFSSKNWPCSI
jgi:hypothetical protein